MSSATGSVASASAELLARAEALLDRGNYESAERILVPIAEGPGARSVHLEAWTLLGDARGARHDHAGALSAWEHVIGLSRGTSRANAIYERTRVLREMHDVEGERAELARYLGEFPNGPNAGSARTRLCSLGGADGVECE